ncbi:dynamin family protein [Crocosphaera chwakensis]|nr:dynamin family protein [Crocosphaera chwakensis]
MKLKSMNMSLMSSKVDSLISQLTGRKLETQNISHPVIFLTSVLAVLNGVICADGIVAEKEKEKLEITLQCLCSHADNLYELAEIISKNIQQEKLYSVNNIITLTESLSESEKLLLLSLGYEISVSDGKIDISEQKYLKHIAFVLEIESQYQKALEAILTNQENVEPDILADLHSLLDPCRFRELDKIFVLAAQQICEQLPQLEKQNINKFDNQDNISPPKASISYQELENFQIHRQQLEVLFNQVSSILKDSHEKGLLTETLIKDMEKVSQSLKSQQFRVAVIGDFSQGKSTLLNALLGEEIQPTRAIPCSGTVSLLKYGEQKRVICHYQNGTEEEIPFEEYEDKVTIDYEVALEQCDINQQLIENPIKEVIFEHPNLALCKNGVIIIDSPGLNEHPDRTAITKQILEDTDAIIFLTDASRPLTQREKEVLQELKQFLNGDNSEVSAENIFLVVNKWDLLRREKDRQQVKERIENIVFSPPALISGDNRVHFLSAQEALDSIINQAESEYLREFQCFAQTLEKFMSEERGYLVIKKYLHELKLVIQRCIADLTEYQSFLNNEVTLSEKAKQEIIEQIGEATGYDIQFQKKMEQLLSEASVQTKESFNRWLEGLSHRLYQKKSSWTSEYSHLWNQNKLAKDYTNQCVACLKKDIDTWVDNDLVKNILLPKIEILEEFITRKMTIIDQNLQSIDKKNNLTLSKKVSQLIKAVQVDITGGGGVLFGGLGGGAVALGLLAFTGVGFIGIIIAAILSWIASSFGLGLLDVDNIHDTIKNKVIEETIQQIEKSQKPIEKDLDEFIATILKSILTKAKEGIDQIIICCEDFLKKQEKIHQENLEKHYKDKNLISQKHQELNQLCAIIDVFLTERVS